MFVSRGQMMALRAVFRGIGRRDPLHGDSRLESLVPDEGLQLVEGPIIPVLTGIGPRLPPLAGPGPDTGEVFQPDSGTLQYCHCHDLLAETMVDVRHPPVFLVLAGLECPGLSRFLERLSLLRELSSEGLDLTGLEENDRSGGGGNNGGDVLPPVDADPPPRVPGTWNLHGGRETGIPQPLAGLDELEGPLLRLSGEEGLKPLGVGSFVNRQRDPLAGASPGANDKTPGGPDEDEFPVLVVGLQRESLEGFRILRGIDGPDGLVHERGVENPLGEVLRGELSPLLESHRKDSVSQAGVLLGQAGKLLGLGDVQPEEGNLQGFREGYHFIHENSLSYI